MTFNEIVATANNIDGDLSKVAASMSPQLRKNLLRWFCGGSHPYRADLLEKALKFSVWCQRHDDLDFWPAEMRQRAISEAAVEFGVPHERLVELVISFPQLSHDQRSGPIFVAFEGIDGSGKTRHIQLLQQYLERSGKSVITFAFPFYEGFFGAELGKILSGRHPLGADRLDPKSMSLWYAVDRWKMFNTHDVAQYDYVLLNRFTLSSVVYQSVRVPKSERDRFADWVFQLEHEQFGLPFPDAYILLDVSPETAQRNVKAKGFREYAGKKPDIYERSEGLLASARARYLHFASSLSSAYLISCMAGSKMKDIKEVHKEIIDCLRKFSIISTTQ